MKSTPKAVILTAELSCDSKTGGKNLKRDPSLSSELRMTKRPQYPRDDSNKNEPQDNAQIKSFIAQVAVPLPIATEAFSYLIPEAMIPKARPGVRVTVPFRNNELTGYIVALETLSTYAVESGSGKVKMKSLLAILDDQPVLSSGMLQLTKWVSEYYGSSWGEAIENALPRWVKFGKKVEKYIEKAKTQAGEKTPRPEEFTLSSQQKKAFEVILKKINQIQKGHAPRATGHEENSSRGTRPSKHELLDGDQRSSGPVSAPEDVDRKTCPVLLFGVTGSGKSELYIRAIRATLAQGRAAICLVPEIALTEQLQRFFAGQFGGDLEILHSKMTDGERFLTWKRIEMGTCRVVLGPRSAVFAPIPNLGLIIMDEEHEGSYKQETTPRYHAREVAAWRAQNENAVFLMGTATPSLETMALAERGQIERIDLTQRIDDKAMPKVEVIDLQRYQGDKRASFLFSPPLAREIGINLKNGEGTMLLLNRRGFSTSIRCPTCKEVEKCKSCQVALTFHQEKNLLLCHYCNYQKKPSNTCSSCQSPLLRFAGFGTEKVESEVARLFPAARIARMDADTTKKKDSHEVLLEKFREGKIDILIGTQMIAKGFDFPHVTLVGVVLADVGLRLPDFRSSERTFQLLTQFAGRAGRGTKPGRVIIQTWMSDHPSIRFAKEHDFLSFYAHEKKGREEFHYPPYRSLVNIIIRGADEKKAYVFAREIRDALRRDIASREPRTTGHEKNPGQDFCSLSHGSGDVARGPRPEVEIIGPAPLPFYKLRGNFRWHVMLKLPIPEPGSRMSAPLTMEIYRTLMKMKKPSGVAFQLDVDPLNIL